MDGTTKTCSLVAPVARHCAFKLFVHGSNGKYRQFPQSPLKALPITLQVWVVFGPLCRPHQDVDDLLHSEPLWRPSNLACFLERAQKSCESLFIFRIQVADP